MMDGPDIAQILRLIAALAFVVALMAGLGAVLKKFGVPGTVTAPGRKKRLQIVEALVLDARRRLVLLQCDGKQHLVILGANGETVVKTDIEIPPETE